MGKPRTAALIAAAVGGGITVAGVAFVIILLLIGWLWAWIIPDLCPGAVEQGLIAGSLSWMTAMKVAFFIAIVAGCFLGGHQSAHWEHSKDHS